MSATVTSDVGEFTAAVRVGATETLDTRNIVHDLISGGVAVSFGEATGATVPLEFVFRSESAALDAFEQLRDGHVFELVDEDKPTTSMIFVVEGELSREFAVDSSDAWTVAVSVRQVQP